MANSEKKSTQASKNGGQGNLYFKKFSGDNARSTRPDVSGFEDDRMQMGTGRWFLSKEIPLVQNKTTLGA